MTLGAADPAAQLIELGQPQPFAFVDNDRVHVWKIESRFNDGCRKQDVVSALIKIQHGLLEQFTSHLPVCNRDTRTGKQPRQQRKPRINVHDAVMHNVHLPVAVQFSLDCPTQLLLIEWHEERAYGVPADRRRVDQRNVANANDPGLQCPRNGRGAQCQDIHLGLHLLDLFLVEHPEQLLFVDDQQTDVLEVPRHIQQLVCADRDVHTAFAKQSAA